MAKKTVNDMKIGERAVVTGLGCSGALRRRIIDHAWSGGDPAQGGTYGRSVGDQRAGV